MSIEKPLTQLIGDLAAEIAGLVRKEIELARSEVTEKITEARQGFVAVGRGSAVIYAGFLFLLLAADKALELELPDWAAAGLIGLVVLLVGYFMVRNGRTHLQIENLKPRLTLQTRRRQSHAS